MSPHKPQVSAAHSADLLAGMALLDTAKQRGFHFRRTAPGPDGPLEGIRETGQWRDVIHLAGFSRNCSAWREHTTTLPHNSTVQICAEGSALHVLNEVLTWPEPPT